MGTLPFIHVRNAVTIAMKLRLPSRLVRDLLTTCAVALSTSSPVFADVPENYTPVVITYVDQLADYTESDYIAFIISSDITDSAYQMSGAHQYWIDDALHTHVLSFEEIESTSDGGVLSIRSELVAVRMQELSFSHNASTSTYGEGGAIYGFSSSVITLSNNGNVTFSENSAPRYGGAIHTFGSLDLTGNNTVTFSGNSAASGGGAIYGDVFASRTSIITLKDNGNVTFSENSAVGDFALGGAIYTYGSLDLTGNNTVTFSGNSAASRGGAIYGAVFASIPSIITLKDNGNVTFSKNSAGWGGGAIYTYGGSLDLTGNNTVTFSGNSAAGHGGAIYGDSSSVITLCDNNSVSFRGNYEKTGSDDSVTYRMRSVYLTESTLTLAAGEGQHITFYDTLYADSTSTVSFNAKYTDKDGVEREATGDVVFSGKYAEEDLKKLQNNPTAQELTNSLTTEVYSSTNLCGGRLRIEDGAIYKGYGINVAEGSHATLRLANGELDQTYYSTKYDVTLASDTTLDLQGVNKISAGSLDLQDGSILSFTLGESNLTTAAVTLTGAFNQGGAMTIKLDDDGTVDDGKKYSLLTMTSGEMPDSWNTAKITVTGLKAKVSDLSWEDGTLYFTTPTPPDLLTATWSGAVSAKWNTTDKNWVQGEFEYQYKDGVDVVFGDTASGKIALEGTLAPKSVLVENSVEHDYAFMGEGSIAGTAAFTKEGTGTLTISTSNTYEGGTFINGGTVVLATSTALGTGDIQLNDGMLDMGGNTIDNNIVTEALVGYAHATIGNGATTGNLTITNTYLTVSGDAQIDGQIQANSENSITVDSDATLGISKAITNAGDYLAIAGRIDISKMHGEVAGSEYTGAENSDNGFLSTTESVQVFNNTTGGDIELGNATFYYQGTQAYLDNDFKTDIQTVDYSTFYVNVDSEKLSSALDAIVELKNGTQLYVDHDTDADLLHVVSGTVTMDIAQGVTLAETDTTRTDFILQGKGRYSLMSGSTTLGAIMGNSWQGIVQINGVTFGALDFNQYGKEGSVVSMNGVTAKFVDGTKFLPTVELLGEGLSITECRTSQTYEFAGGVTGEGNLTYRLTKMPNNQTYIFTGDVSQWTGAYDSDADGKTSSLVFYGKATEMGAAILQTAGTVNVEVGDGANLFATTFMNTVQATNFTVLEAATASFTAGTQITEKLDSTGTMQIQDEGSISVDGAIEIRAAAEYAPGAMSSIIATTTQLNSLGKEKAELIGCYVDIKENYIMENVSISGTVIDISAGKTLYVKHADIKADARITDEAAWLDMVDTHGWLNEDNTDASSPTMDLANVMFYKSGETDTWMWLTEDVSYVTLTSYLFSNVTLTGSDLWLDLTGLKDTIGNAQAFSIAFKDALYDVNGLRVVATVDGEHYFDGYYTTQQDGTTTTLYFSSQIPEPSTGTLSLLALASLAARRRRK